MSWVSCVTQSLCVRMVLKNRCFGADSQMICCSAFTESILMLAYFSLPYLCTAFKLLVRLYQNVMMASQAQTILSKNIFKCKNLCAVWPIITVCESEAKWWDWKVLLPACRLFLSPARWGTVRFNSANYPMSFPVNRSTKHFRMWEGRQIKIKLQRSVTTSHQSCSL